MIVTQMHLHKGSYAPDVETQDLVAAFSVEFSKGGAGIRYVAFEGVLEGDVEAYRRRWVQASGDKVKTVSTISYREYIREVFKSD